jgi:hypothetical protein
LLKKIHTYTGLLTFVNLTVFGIVGLSAMLESPDEEPPPASSVQYRGFTVEPNLTDRQVAERLCAVLRLSLATPVQSAAIQRDSANNLFFDFRHANGRHQVTVLEKEGRIRVEEYRNDIGDYLDTLHRTTAAFKSGDWRMRLWAIYNEFAMWCLLGMIVTGVWLWLSTRRRHRLASLSLAAGCGIFAVLYFWTK